MRHAAAVSRQFCLTNYESLHHAVHGTPPLSGLVLLGALIGLGDIESLHHAVHGTPPLSGLVLLGALIGLGDIESLHHAVHGPPPFDKGGTGEQISFNGNIEKGRLKKAFLFYYNLKSYYLLLKPLLFTFSQSFRLCQNLPCEREGDRALRGGGIQTHKANRNRFARWWDSQTAFPVSGGNLIFPLD